MKDVKPVCKMVGKDGNVFNLMGLARKTLIGVGKPKEADEMIQKVMDADSYNSALAIMSKYVTIR
jgi:hypothetical protein